MKQSFQVQNNCFGNVERADAAGLVIGNTQLCRGDDRNGTFGSPSVACRKLVYYVTFCFFLSICVVEPLSSAVKRSTTARSTRLHVELQHCRSIQQLLDRVGRHITPMVDPHGRLNCLVWVRLCKLIVAEKNNNSPTNNIALLHHDLDTRILGTLTESFVTCASRMSVDDAVDLTKATAVIVRLIPELSSAIWPAIDSCWKVRASAISELMESHHLSGLQWAFQTARVVHSDSEMSSEYQHAYKLLNLPFRIFPGALNDMRDLHVDRLLNEVNFRVDTIRTPSNEKVQERRQTAWQGDDGVGDFVYSGKSMQREIWSPLVSATRDRIDRLSRIYYDCCLLNLYPDGDSGMRYHTDPDQGTLWDYNTAVVSLGATRRFAFRATDATGGKPHSFYVLDRDVVHMFADCQVRFQHTVKKAELKEDGSSRVSLVFKRTWERNGE